MSQVKKGKWRGGSKVENEEEAERKKLKVSLETGESQISFRYAADMNKFGDIIRVGDGPFSPSTSEVRKLEPILTNHNSHRTRPPTPHCCCHADGYYHEPAASCQI